MSLRKPMNLSALVFALCAVTHAYGQMAPAASPAAPTAEELDQAVTEGVQYMASQAEMNLQAVRTLQMAIASENLTEAQAAYGRSRAWYEEIEVLAYAFPEIDSDIDARPYAFPEGSASEASPLDAESGSVFLGFHAIEGLLFRDSNVTAANDYATRLVNSSEQLVAALGNRSNFDAPGQFRLMVALAIEVGGKKVSSEEETYSDLSLLIFDHNFQGIRAVYTPFAPLVARADPLVAAMVQDALSGAFLSVAPYAFFNNGEETHVPYSYVTTAQRAPIQNAAYMLASILQQAADALSIDLNQSEEEEEECMPTVQATDVPANASSIQRGLNYFRAVLPTQMQLVANLTAAIESRDLGAAKAAYTRSRPVYEQIEVLAASFLDIDADIDAREYAFPNGERDEAFKGSHRLEALLFRDGDSGPQALFYAQGLEESFAALNLVFNQSGNDSEVFNAKNNFGGIIGLATEIVAKKVSSEEEKYSDHSWLIFYNNYKGIYSQALPFYTPATQNLRTELEEGIEAAVGCMPVTTTDQILDVDVGANPAQFVERLATADYGQYSSADMEQKQCLDEAGYRVRDVLMRTAAALNLFDDCSDYYTPGTATPQSF